MMLNITKSGAYYDLTKFMSPFSVTFHDLRMELQLRQADLADKLGYEQSYISALEIGTKGPPAEAFVEKLIDVLELDKTWQQRLWDSVEASQRKIIVPTEAPEAVYRLCNELRLQLDRLHPAQIELIRIALQLPKSMKTEVPPSRRRLRRRPNGNQEEATQM